LGNKSGRDSTRGSTEASRSAGSRVVTEYVAARNAHDVSRVSSLFAGDGSYAEFGGGSVMFGREEISRHLTAVCSAVPDLTLALTAAPDFNGECVLLRWAIEGTQQGEFAGVPASGSPFRIRGTSTFFLRGDKILRALDCFDVHQLRAGACQSGSQPPPGLPTRVVGGQETIFDSDEAEDNICWGE
jgi:steroid delta-isomerase-like uncharacterized protein